VEFLLVLLILLAVVYVVTGPLRGSRADRGSSSSTDRDGTNLDGPDVRAGAAPASDPRAFERESELSELEAAREAKYREIRDTQLDYDTGKLSQEDFETLDTGLRREALEILQRIDRLHPVAPVQAPSDSAEPGPSEPE
jgi:hypothetical protein